MKRIDKKELESVIKNWFRYFPAPEDLEKDIETIFHSGDLENILNYFKKEYKGRLSKEAIEPSDRVLNHWENLGIIPSNRTKEKGWRIYGFLDHVWTFMVIELRKLGYLLEPIKQIKDNLSLLKEYANSDYPMLVLFFAYAVSNKDVIYLLAFEDGHSELVLRKDLILALAEGKELPNHIMINVTNIIKHVDDIFPEQIQPRIPTILDLDSKERRIIEVIRQPKITNIIIHKELEKPTRMEYSLTAKVDEAQYNSEFNTVGFGSLEVKKADGKLIHAKVTRSEKL